jgi:hypothetical protein
MHGGVRLPTLSDGTCRVDQDDVLVNKVPILIGVDVCHQSLEDIQEFSETALGGVKIIYFKICSP